MFNNKSLPESPRYQSLDLWRGVACLLVIVHHCTFPRLPEQSEHTLQPAELAFVEFCHKGWIGVPIFFVISGYCIAASLDRLSKKEDQISTRTFFARRFWRIFPTYWAALLSITVLVTLVDTVFSPTLLTKEGLFLRPWWYSTSQWFGNIFLIETWRWHFFGASKSMIWQHTWTLNYEEQFYVAMGLILFLFRSKLFAGLATVTAASCSIQILSATYGFSIEGFFFGPLWFQFAMGALVYTVINYPNFRIKTLTYSCIAIGLLWSISGIQKWLEPGQPLHLGHFVAFTFSLLLILLHRWDAALASSTKLAFLRSCGIMSFSIYLVHEPITHVIRALLTALNLKVDTFSPIYTLPFYASVSIGTAWLFFHGVERRFISVKNNTSAK